MRRPVFIARQGRHPYGWLGAIIGRIMASETAADNDRAIAMLGVLSEEHVLDVGTGHGRSLATLAAAADNVTATGIDASDVMLTIARRRHKALIRQGRVRVERASSDDLPFAAATFDRVMAVHTLYFWQPAAPHLKSMARVLKPGGRGVLGFRPAEDAALTARFPASVYAFRTTAEVEALLATAGLVIVDRQCRDVPGNSMVWLAATPARQPVLPGTGT